MEDEEDHETYSYWKASSSLSELGYHLLRFAYTIAMSRGADQDYSSMSHIGRGKEPRPFWL